MSAQVAGVFIGIALGVIWITLGFGAVLLCVVLGIVGWVVALVYLGPALYAVLLLVAAVTTAGSLADRIRFMAVIAIMHFSWGTGFLRGIIRGAGDAVDTSRTES